MMGGDGVEDKSPTNDAVTNKHMLRESTYIHDFISPSPSNPLAQPPLTSLSLSLSLSATANSETLETMPTSMPSTIIFLITLALSSTTTLSSVSTTVAKDQVSCTMCTECENPCQPLPPPPPPVECPPPPSPPPPVVECPPPPLPPPPPPPAEVECPPPPAPPCDPCIQPPPQPPCPGGPNCKPPPCPGGPNCRPPRPCTGGPNCRPVPGSPMPWMTPGITFPIYQPDYDNDLAGTGKVYAVQYMIPVASLCLAYYYFVI